MAIAKVSCEHFNKWDTCWIFSWFLWFLFMVKYRTLIYGFDTSHVVITPIILSIYWWYFAAFNSSHTTFPLLSICTNRLWAHYLGFCLHPSISFFLPCYCIMWLWFASLHPDFNPCTLQFYFFRYNFWTCCKYNLCVAIFFTWLTLGLSYNETILLHLHLFIFMWYLVSI